ncbi:MAG: 1-phosphofructokinase family hexose kinase [Clostridiales bacterium]|nr:1-phosphofructokinase family hexose kinase [Clostridiales bacterium]
MYLTLTLNPSIDHYVRLPEGQLLLTGSPEAPSVNRASAESFEAGGKGINVAKILRRLSADVEATGFTAGFTGSEIIRDIEAEGIVSRFIEVHGLTRINTKITDGTGVETEINGTGPSITPSDISRLISVINGSCCDTLFISGSLPSGTPADTYSLIVSAVRQSNPDIRLVLDCEGEALLKCLPSKPFLIKPNAHELSALTGIELTTSSPLPVIRDAAAKLIQRGAQNVLVSLGSSGACLLTGDGVFLSASGINGDVISTIGAGDTMLASFIYMLDRDNNYRRALDCANGCAAKAAFSQGLPDAEALKAVIKEFS